MNRFGGRNTPPQTPTQDERLADIAATLHRIESFLRESRDVRSMNLASLNAQIRREGRNGASR